jgi:hypothetical protein
MNIVWIVQRLGPAPNDRKRGRQVGRPRRIDKLHVVAVDRVAEQLGVDASHPTFNVELANEAGLNDELTDDVHLDLDGLFDAGRHEDLAFFAGGVDGGAEAGSGAVGGADALQGKTENEFWGEKLTILCNTHAHAGHEDVISAVFGRVVSTAMRFDAPIAREPGRNALGAGDMRRTVEEREIGRHQVRSGGRSDAQS